MEKETATEWLFKQLWEEPKDKFTWNAILMKAKEMEKDQKHKSIDKQVSIIKSTLEEMMTGFDSEENRIDFILDICNGYKKRINN